jgi:formaldehyde-activating enzyme involved in methanogenesis
MTRFESELIEAIQGSASHPLSHAVYDIAKAIHDRPSADLVDVEDVLSKFFTNCNGQDHGYDNNITAALFAIASAIGRVADNMPQRDIGRG